MGSSARVFFVSVDCIYNTRSWWSSVDTVNYITGWTTLEFVFDSQKKQDIFPVSKTSSPIVGP